MNSIFIAVLSSFCGFLLGLSLSNRGREREAYYRDVTKLCSGLIDNISYKADKILSVLDNIEINSAALKKNISEYKAYLKGDELSISSNCLTKVETARVKEFFSRLGRTDGETQIGELKRTESEFKHKYGEIKEKNDKQGNMYIKLGLLFGLLVGILLI